MLLAPAKSNSLKSEPDEFLKHLPDSDISQQEGNNGGDDEKNRHWRHRLAEKLTVTYFPVESSD